jgi:hypothetical protein
MSLNPFTTFLDDCQIPDPESQYIKRSDCDTMFIVCNFQVRGSKSDCVIMFIVCNFQVPT